MTDPKDFSIGKSLSSIYLRGVFPLAVKGPRQNMTVAPGIRGSFLFSPSFGKVLFLQAFKQSRCPPCKQRLMTRWGGEINTIKSDRENTLLWLTSHKSMLFSKNNPRSYLSGSYSHISKIDGENRQRSLAYCAKFHTRSYTLNSQCTVHMLGSFK